MNLEDADAAIEIWKLGLRFNISRYAMFMESLTLQGTVQVLYKLNVNAEYLMCAQVHK